jgi:hypothetical protein
VSLCLGKSLEAGEREGSKTVFARDGEYNRAKRTTACMNDGKGGVREAGLGGEPTEEKHERVVTVARNRKDEHAKVGEQQGAGTGHDSEGVLKNAVKGGRISTEEGGR